MEEGNVAVARVKVKVEVMKGALRNGKSRRPCLPKEVIVVLCENGSTVCIPWWR